MEKLDFTTLLVFIWEGTDLTSSRATKYIEHGDWPEGLRYPMQNETVSFPELPGRLRVLNVEYIFEERPRSKSGKIERAVYLVFSCMKLDWTGSFDPDKKGSE